MTSILKSGTFTTKLSVVCMTQNQMINLIGEDGWTQKFKTIKQPENASKSRHHKYDFSYTK